MDLMDIIDSLLKGRPRGDGSLVDYFIHGIVIPSGVLIVSLVLFAFDKIKFMKGNGYVLMTLKQYLFFVLLILLVMAFSINEMIKL